MLKEKPYHLTAAATPAPGSNWSEDDFIDLKQALNKLVWQYGPRTMLLADAEDLTQELHRAIMVGSMERWSDA